MEQLEGWWVQGVDLLTRPIFTVGSASFSLTSVAKFFFFLIVLLWASRAIRRLLLHRVLPKLRLETGISHAMANIVAYTVIALGLMVGLQSSGINMGTITVLFGAVGVGIGFGLQTIASNFMSGLIILIERPISVGDRIQLGDLNGRVTRINIRATEIITNDSIAVIVPNSEFISQQVINWSHGGDTMRIRVPVGVDYGSNLQIVRTALMEAAASVEGILSTPPPKVRLTGFGDSSIDFLLLGWTRDLLHQRGEITSRINFAIHEALQRHRISIPFPQRDLHLRSTVSLPVGVGEKPV